MKRSEESFFRIGRLPPYPLGEIAQAVREARLSGRDIIDLSQINPDQPPPSLAVDKLVQGVLQPHNHRYSSSQGISRLRESCVGWYRKRYDVELSAEREVVVSMGTKEGLSHLLLSVASPGDTVLVPTPSYPIHTSSVFIAGAGVVGLPLFSSWDEADANGFSLSEDSEEFFERLSCVYNRTWPHPKMMVLSFPHNPTTTTVTKGFFKRLVEFGRRNSMYLVHDFAYADLCFDGYRAPSILEVEGAREIAVECYSLSKSYSLAGWRIGFCVGNQKLIGALKELKSYLDFGIFQPLQIAAATLLESAVGERNEYLEETVALYQSRRTALVDGLSRIGWDCHMPKATVFVWSKIPESVRCGGSMAFGHRLLEQSDVAVCPGGGFDIRADEYVRFALVEPEARLRAAVERMKKL